MSSRDELFAAAADIISGDRQDTYGTALENFTSTGKLWATVFGHPVTPEQVAICMVLLKVDRLRRTPSHEDSWIDILGYAALGAEIATDKS
jgi:hypothetical protein